MGKGSTRRKSNEKREPNGRVKRVWQPDRGTEELQARRAAVTGDARRPVDLTDPIDRLHRGSIKHITDEQALAATIWRASMAVVLAGEGPKLAMLTDGRVAPLMAARLDEEERIARARDRLETIETALRAQPLAVQLQVKDTVLHRQTARRLGDLKTGLDAIAKALRL